jgi:hypothetical protein
LKLNKYCHWNFRTVSQNISKQAKRFILSSVIGTFISAKVDELIKHFVILKLNEMETYDYFKEYSKASKYSCALCNWCGINSQSLSKHMRDCHPLSEEHVSSPFTNKNNDNDDDISDSALQKLISTLSDDSLTNGENMGPENMGNEDDEIAQSYTNNQSNKRPATHDVIVNEDAESLVSLIIGETFDYLDFHDVSSIEDSLSSSNTFNDFADDETESSNESEAIQEVADDTFMPRMRGGRNEENIRNCQNPSDFGDDILLKLKDNHKGDDKK